MISSNEARIRTNQTVEFLCVEQLNAIESLIEDAIDQGKYEITYPRAIFEDVEIKLREELYDVELLGLSTKISWA